MAFGQDRPTIDRSPPCPSKFCLFLLYRSIAPHKTILLRPSNCLIFCFYPFGTSWLSPQHPLASSRSFSYIRWLPPFAINATPLLLHQLRHHLPAISSYTDRPPSSMQPMHTHLSWFSDQDKIRRRSSIEAARLILIFVPGFSPKLHSLATLVRSPVVRLHKFDQVLVHRKNCSNLNIIDEQLLLIALFVLPQGPSPPSLEGWW